MNRSINLSRVAIITGGGRGMGRAMAIGLAKAGNHVIITAARECAEIDSVAHQAAEACGDSRVLPIVADVTIDEDCRRVIDTAMKRFGRLDILVNNAARGMKYVSRSFMTEAPRFWTTDPLVWRMVIDTNVNGPYLMARHAVPAMLQRGGGRIINVTVNQETMRRGASHRMGLPKPRSTPKPLYGLRISPILESR